MSDLKYTYWENTTGKTMVLSTKHPNINMWFMADTVVSLTETEAKEYDIENIKGVQQTSDKAKIKKALRPNQARKAMIDKKFEKPKPETDEKDPGGFNTRPKVALDPITKKPVTDVAIINQD